MDRKRWILLFSIVSLIALVILAAGLHNVQFEPGKPVPYIMPTVNQAPVDVPGQIAQIPLWKIILLWGAFLLNMLLFFFLLSPEARKRIFKEVIRFALTALAIYIALRNYYLKVAEQNADQNPQANAGADLPPVDGIGSTFHPPQMTPLTTFLVSMVVLLVFFILLWIGYRWWRRRYGWRSNKALVDIAAIARSSLKDIASGRDWSDVIIQSYVRMGEVVSRTRGLQRAEAMTPREFAERLQMTGLPAESVLQLTRLFESVRYGAHQSDQKEIKEAVACLNSILSACGVTQ